MSKTFTGLSLAQLKSPTQEIANSLSKAVMRTVVINFGDQQVVGTGAFFVEGDKIEVTLDPNDLANTRSAARALAVWHGLAGVAVAKALSPAKSQVEKAKKEGYQHLFALLRHEQSIRRMIAADPNGAPYLQTFNAHLAPVSDINSATVDFDHSELGTPKEGTVAGTTTYGQRFNGFAYELLRGRDSGNAVAHECMGMIPSNFKDLDAADLLALAKQIHTKLGADAEIGWEQEVLPAVDEQTAAAVEPIAISTVRAKPLKAVEPEDDRDSKRRRPSREYGAGVARGLSVLMGVGTIAWIWALMHFGYGFWTFWSGVVVAAGLVGTGLYILRGPVGAAFRAFMEVVSDIFDAIRNSRVTRPILGAIAGLLVAAFVVLIIWKVAAVILITLVSNLAIVACLIYACTRTVAPGEKSGGWTDRCWGLGMIAATAISVVTFAIGMMNAGFALWFVVFTAIVPVVALGSVALTLVLPEMGGTGDGALGLPARIARRVIAILVGGAYGVGAVFMLLGQALLMIRDAFLFVLGLIGQLIELTIDLVRLACFYLEPSVAKLMAKPWVRALVLPFPVAFLACCAAGAFHNTGTTFGWILFALVAAVFAAVVVYMVLNFQSLLRWASNEQVEAMPGLVGTSTGVPVDKEHDEWKPIEDFVSEVEPDPAFVERERALVNGLSTRLLQRLEAAGSRPRDIDQQPDGHDLGDNPEDLLQGDLNVFVEEDRKPVPSVYLGAAIDNSDSTLEEVQPWPRGEKARRERVLEMTLEQAARSLPWMTFEGIGFNDSQIFILGSEGFRASGLVPRGGNNDTAALAYMRQRAENSGRRLKILAMLSDIQPADATWLSLHKYARQCKQDGLVPWQIQFDVTENPLDGILTTDAFHKELEAVVDEIADRLIALIQERC